MEEQKRMDIIDLRDAARQLWSKKNLFFKVWGITFILSCIWILPQPRYYVSEVRLAPEMSGEDIGGGISSIASSFGINLGGVGGQDAIYPELYPELFENPEFIVGLYDVPVTTIDGSLKTTYYIYMKEHQKKNPLTAPFRKLNRTVKGWFEEEDTTPRGSGAQDINPFRLNKKDYALMKAIMDGISCSVDTKNSVISIKVKDQDPLVSATMTDSVRSHLQDFIIRYRTSKASEDVAHYAQMRDSAELEYKVAMEEFSRYSDTHMNALFQSYQSERDKLESRLALKQNALAAMEAQLQSTKVKLQEKTPAFTTLKSVTVPIKPAGPKRMLFVFFMLLLATLVSTCYVLQEDLGKFLIIYGKKH